MALQAGALNGADNFVDADCMAKYMEDALPAAADPEDSGKRGRRLFLIGIATGIINYLKDHDDDSFLIHVALRDSTYTATLDIL
jgi:hypothetical protein